MAKDRYKIHNASWFRNTNSLEATFSWLITLGILRREVDGQGLTSKIRLTPLGRQILEKDPTLPTKKAGFFSRIVHWVYRKWPMR